MLHILKRLELNGFKSFAGKTEFAFPSGITAIVGPNGSGKSNIVDAVRWLLGERDAKNLRGARVEDLIFAGTPKRPRLGQARASLYFENTGSFFPIEAAEVVVTREVSRDGESRYFLNKAEVLLRDLVDFLARARLGSKGLAVVTQGASDVFIRSSSKERREMIEEILGLREYQIKRFDAWRRLARTKSNLEKAKALIEELLPHLRSLRRQTSRWEKRGELAAELRALEDKFFGSQCGALHSELARIEETLVRDEADLAVLRETACAAERRQEEVEASRPEERRHVGSIRERIRTLLEERSQLEKDAGRVEAQLELAEKRARKTERSAERMLRLLEEVRDRLEAAIEGDGDAAREAMETIIEDINMFFESDEEGEEDVQLAGVREELHAMRAKTERIREELRALQDEEKTLDAREESFYAEFKEALRRVEEAKKKIEARELDHRERQFHKERVLLRREELMRQVMQAGRDPKEFEQARAPRLDDRELSEIERRMFKLRGDLASIGDIDEALVKEAQETETRYSFLKKESDDLENAARDLDGLTQHLTSKIRNEFDAAVVKINDELKKLFELMFGGGHATLRATKPAERAPSEIGENASGKKEEAGADGEEEKAADREEAEGVDIEVKLPRKKINSLEALSGGERSLVGIAALFALISVSPPPFLVLDEVDAALDERNSKRFADILREFSRRTQFVVVTHNRTTMEVADVLYGVTLSDDGTSKVISLKFDPVMAEALSEAR